LQQALSSLEPNKSRELSEAERSELETELVNKLANKFAPLSRPSNE